MESAPASLPHGRSPPCPPPRPARRATRTTRRRAHPSPMPAGRCCPESLPPSRFPHVSTWRQATAKRRVAQPQQEYERGPPRHVEPLFAFASHPALKKQRAKRAGEGDIAHRSEAHLRERIAAVQDTLRASQMREVIGFDKLLETWPRSLNEAAAAPHLRNALIVRPALPKLASRGGMESRRRSNLCRCIRGELAGGHKPRGKLSQPRRSSGSVRLALGQHAALHIHLHIASNSHRPCIDDRMPRRNRGSWSLCGRGFRHLRTEL